MLRDLDTIEGADYVLVVVLIFGFVLQLIARKQPVSGWLSEARLLGRLVLSNLSCGGLSLVSQIHEKIAIKTITRLRQEIMHPTVEYTP